MVLCSGPVHIFRGKIDACSDSDHAGCIDTSRSTSGWAVYLKSSDDGDAFTALLVDWGSKRQAVVAKSTTEAEVVAINESTCRNSLPSLGLVEAHLNCEVLLVHRIDSDPARQAAVSGNNCSERQ